MNDPIVKERTVHILMIIMMVFMFAYMGYLWVDINKPPEPDPGIINGVWAFDGNPDYVLTFYPGNSFVETYSDWTYIQDYSYAYLGDGKYLIDGWNYYFLVDGDNMTLVQDSVSYLHRVP